MSKIKELCRLILNHKFARFEPAKETENEKTFFKAVEEGAKNSKHQDKITILFDTCKYDAMEEAFEEGFTAAVGLLLTLNGGLGGSGGVEIERFV